jgi:hypothetical protein
LPMMKKMKKKVLKVLKQQQLQPQSKSFYILYNAPLKVFRGAFFWLICN